MIWFLFFCFLKYEVQKEELERKNWFLNLSSAFKVGPSGNINLKSSISIFVESEKTIAYNQRMNMFRKLHLKHSAPSIHSFVKFTEFPFLNPSLKHLCVSYYYLLAPSSLKYLSNIGHPPHTRFYFLLIAARYSTPLIGAYLNPVWQTVTFCVVFWASNGFTV